MQVSEYDVGAHAAGNSGTSAGGAAGTVKDTAREEASNVAGTAKQEATNVAGTAKDEASNVASTAKQEAANVASTVTGHARTIASEVKQRVSSEASTHNDNLANMLRKVADELEEMVSGRDSSPASSVVGSVANGTRKAADYVSERGPEGLLTEVGDFARRRPGAFLAVAAAAGLVVGRLGKGVKAATSDSGDQRSPSTAYTPAPYPAADPYATSQPVADDLSSSQVYVSSSADPWATAPGTVAGPAPIVPASTSGSGLIATPGEVADPKPQDFIDAAERERGMRP